MGRFVDTVRGLRIRPLAIAALVTPGMTLLSGCEQQVSFAEDVQPLLAANCAGCHSGYAEGETSTGLNVTDYASLMHGTRLGEVVVPGSAASSTLYLVVSGESAPQIQMPPHHEESLAEGRGAPLDKDEVQLIKDWIDQGAKNN
ncbi:c-type cytochrome domain-containing protein [Lentisalinibacter sediminis]|uniref:c-type cytochrome domain-containing protein n=1 Tax=Lentisalinibacter sediminis TaxID=2992237 RepID=UPI00386CA51F